MVIFVGYNNGSMKRIIYALILASVFMASCSDEVTLTPGISFLTPGPEVLEETAIFRVIGQPFSSIDSLTIPVVFGGTAERGVDYEASADHFTFKGENLTDSIVIFTKKLGTGRKVSLSLQIPEGFTAGKYAMSEFKLQDNFGYLSFESARGFIADTTSYAIAISDSTGKAKVLSKKATFSFSVNTEKSTAVEGEDFQILGPSELELAAGKSYTEFLIAPIGDSPKEGKDKIVLNITSDEKFAAGKFAEMELNILRSDLSVLDGRWQIDTLLTDSLHFESIWGTQCTGYDLLPKFSGSDRFDIYFLNGLFDPAFRSGLKQYFTGDSNIVFGEEMEITDLDGKAKTVQLISLDKTNRYFSSEESSEDTLSYVGIYLYKEVIDEIEEDMMEFYFLDHTSKSFMPELESSGAYGPEKPVAVDPKLYLCATFRRI